MSCCGQGRAALRAEYQRVALAATPPATPVLRAPLALAHAGPSATVARGAATGLTYLFGADGAPLEVDGRDAPALLASGRFVAAAVLTSP